MTTDGGASRRDATTRRRAGATDEKTRIDTFGGEFFGGGARATRVGDRGDRGSGGEFADADAGGEEETDVGEGSDRVVSRTRARDKRTRGRGRGRGVDRSVERAVSARTLGRSTDSSGRDRRGVPTKRSRQIRVTRDRKRAFSEKRTVRIMVNAMRRTTRVTSSLCGARAAVAERAPPTGARDGWRRLREPESGWCLEGVG